MTIARGLRGLIIAVTALLLAVPALAYSPGASGSAHKNAAKRSAPAARTPASTAQFPAAPVVVSGTAAGQAGYVHYFVITGPDGEPESHVGLELPGDRIAWSFPELGVYVTPFIARGVVDAKDKEYQVEHLYGLRPFRDEESMRALQRDLADRVAWWVGENIPFCDEETPPNRFCVSCLGFVLRVLYPGNAPGVPALPADFRSARRSVYTTEDLLMYLAGVRIDVPRQARLKQIAALKVPDIMRDELVRIVESDASASMPAAPASATAKPRPASRSVAQSPKRAAPRKGT